MKIKSRFGELSAIGVECGGEGERGHVYPHFLEWAIRYPPLFRHAWH